MKLRYILLLFVVTSLQAKDRFLLFSDGDTSHKKVALRAEEVQEFKTLALKLQEIKNNKKKEKQIRAITAKEKKRLKVVEKQQRKEERKIRKKMVRLQKKYKSRQNDFLRKVKALGKKRREKIGRWRNYVGSKKAANYLMKLVKDVDHTKPWHVEQLKQEVNSFVDERLNGDASNYPELLLFLS